MSPALTNAERRQNVECMLRKFRQENWRSFGKIKGDHTRLAIWLLAWLYVYCDESRLYAHADAVKHAVDNFVYHLDDEAQPLFARRDTNGFSLDPLSRDQYQFVTDWFEEGINWAESQRTAPKQQRPPRQAKQRELVAA